MTTNLILCGGNGTRLWPLSRTLMPKQFLPLFDGRSLFQLTVSRNDALCDRTLVVSNAEQYFLATDQLEEIGADPASVDCLLEPFGRNTAAAIALAALASDPDTLLLVTPSDHLIKEERAYAEAVDRAKRYAEEGYIVTFGIRPLYAETGYGYIEAAGDRVLAFHEKPDSQTAERYLKSDDDGNGSSYFWNSGMFCFRAGTILEEFDRHAPEILQAARVAMERARREEGILRISHEAMASIPEESVDVAVMERSDRLRVVPCEIGWSDLGSFDALAEELPVDERGNSAGEEIVALNAHGNFVWSEERLVALADIDDLIVVDTADALLITKKGSSQRIREIVKELRERRSELPHIHVTAHRPWGTYTILEESDRYKIKRIVVKPGKRLSLQKHFHRSEHWIVVSGTALVRVGEEEKIVRPNESVYIPMGELHRLENPGRIPLVLVEAQVGEYTGEDDIVRLEDDFARK